MRLLFSTPSCFKYSDLLLNAGIDTSSATGAWDFWHSWDPFDSASSHYSALVDANRDRVVSSVLVDVTVDPWTFRSKGSTFAWEGEHGGLHKLLKLVLVTNDHLLIYLVSNVSSGNPKVR